MSWILDNLHLNVWCSESYCFRFLDLIVLGFLIVFGFCIWISLFSVILILDDLRLNVWII